MVSFLQVFLAKPSIHFVPFRSHPPLFDRPNVWRRVQIIISAICSILWSPIVIFLLEPNTYLSTLFWITLSPYYSLNMRDQVSHPYNTTGCSIFFNLVPFILLVSCSEFFSTASVFLPDLPSRTTRRT